MVIVLYIFFNYTRELIFTYSEQKYAFHYKMITNNVFIIDHLNQPLMCSEYKTVYFVLFFFL